MASRASCKASARFHESHTLCISGGYVHTHTITHTHGHDHFRTDGTHSHRHSSAELERAVEAKGCTKAQLALAWMLAKWPHVVPIPGMRSDARIEENLGAADVSLSPDELAEVEEALSHIVIHGNRTDEDIQRMGYVKPQ